MEKPGNLLVSLPLAVVLLALGCAETSGECPVDCGLNLKCCDGLCVDMQNNVNHCGYCSRSCGEGELCRGGECIEGCGDMPVPCGTGQTCCDGECVDTRTSADHCGECSRQCDVGWYCVAGDCDVLTCDPACEASQTCCKVGTSNTCVDLNADRNNCGACGNPCGITELCKDGTCSADLCDPACSGTQKCCNGTCKDTQTDPQNCGFCGETCDAVTSDSCTAGQCSCKGALECGTDKKCCPDLGCRNIQTDPSNCGECGAACSIGETCVEGSCGCGTTGAPCAETEACCSGACLDISEDPLNCGGCGTGCTAKGPDCVAGQCMCGSSPACPADGAFFACMNNTYDRFQMCCDGACVPQGIEHCGACETACAETDTCTGVFMFVCNFTCQAGTTP